MALCGARNDRRPTKTSTFSRIIPRQPGKALCPALPIASILSLPIDYLVPEPLQERFVSRSGWSATRIRPITFSRAGPSATSGATIALPVPDNSVQPAWRPSARASQTLRFPQAKERKKKPAAATILGRERPLVVSAYLTREFNLNPGFRCRRLSDTLRVPRQPYVWIWEAYTRADTTTCTHYIGVGGGVRDAWCRCASLRKLPPQRPSSPHKAPAP